MGAPGTGKGDRNWQASLMRSIESTANLQYLGKMTQAEVNELLGKAHIFVNMSSTGGQRLMDDRESRARYAERGRQYAALQHSLKNAARLAELLESYAVGKDRQDRVCRGAQ
jgi:hypothetical protein